MPAEVARENIYLDHLRCLHSLPRPSTTTSGCHVLRSGSLCFAPSLRDLLVCELDRFDGIDGLDHLQVLSQRAPATMFALHSLVLGIVELVA